MFSYDRLGMIGHLAHVVNSVVCLNFESSTSQKIRHPLLTGVYLR